MKGTNPETQGHRWAKRVKKRRKKEQREDGQWEDLEREKAREAEEAAAAAAWEASASASASASESERADLDGATDLRDEEGLDPAELAAVRAVKAAAAAAAERLARLEKDAEATREGEEKREGASNAKRAKRKEKDRKPPTRRAPVSSNPFAALGRLRRSRDAAEDDGAAVVDPGTERTGRGDVPGSIPGDGAGDARRVAARRREPQTTRVKNLGASAIDARNRLAAEGAAAAVSRRRVLGIVGVSGSSAKKLKKQLKRARRAGAH